MEGELEQGQEHLTDAQVEQCGRLRPNTGPVEIELHLSGCRFCLERLLNWQRIEFKRFEIAGMQREEAYSDCRSDEEIRDVAAGMVSAKAAARILEHAAQCDHCGPLLNQYFEIFSDETSPEIEALIDQSPSSRPGWARAKAREIVRLDRARVGICAAATRFGGSSQLGSSHICCVYRTGCGDGLAV
jgi:hypothetical protein